MMTEILIIILGTTMLYVFSVSRLESYVKALSAQGFILFLLVLFGISRMTWLNVAFLVFETLIVKAIVIPYFLLTVIRKSETSREIEPYLSQFYSLLIATAIFAFGFIAAFWVRTTGSHIRPLYFGISIAIIILSLFLIVNRKRILTHILAYMMLENGIFLLSLSVANELPMLVNIGVLLDLFVAIYLFAIFFNKINEIFDGSHVDALTELKD